MQHSFSRKSILFFVIIQKGIITDLTFLLNPSITIYETYSF